MDDEIEEPKVGVLVPFGGVGWLDLYTDIAQYVNRTWPDLILNHGGAHQYDWDMDILHDDGIMVYFKDRAKAMSFKLAMQP